MGTKKNGQSDTAKPARPKAPTRAKASDSAKKPASAKRTTAKRTTAKRKTAAAGPSHEEIATRAYFIALETGTSDELHNWLRAEGELTTGG